MTAPQGDRPVIEVHDLFSLYPTPRGHVAALRGLSLVVMAGERIVIHGPNGSGKTTLLAVMSGDRSPSAGTVRVAGVDLAGAEPAELAALRGTKLGLLAQHHGRTLRPELSVLDNVALQLRLGGQPVAAARMAALNTLKSLGLGGLAKRSPTTLSGGEAQRVAICAAVAHGPSVVLADEPTGELDRESAESVYDMLAAATAAVGACLVVVSHDVEASRIADRVVRIRDGRLSEQWTPEAAENETQVVDDRGWLRLPEALRRKIGVTSTVRAELRDAEIVLTAAGAVAAPQQTAAAPVAASAASRKVVASLSEIGIRRGGREITAGLTFDLRAGELTVLRGPSGSGKTTVLRVLAGLEQPETGTVIVNGLVMTDLNRLQRADLRRTTVAIAAQNGALIETFDIDENLKMLRTARGLSADQAVIDHWIETLGLTAIRRRHVRVLSGGERQRVALARVLAAEPTLAILDEPTSQQDEANAELLVRVLQDAATAGLAIISATHDPLLAAAAAKIIEW